MEMEAKIKEALDKIRPFLQNDGGDVEFVARIVARAKIIARGFAFSPFSM